VRIGGRRTIVAGAIATALVLATAACGGPSATAIPSGRLVSPATGASSASGAVIAAPGSPSGAPTASTPAVSGAPGPITVLDPSLLAILPASVGGAIVTEEPASFAEAIRDASFVANVDRAAFAVVVDGTDLASGVVAHLRPNVFSAAFFNDWRATYDEGACAQAGGIVAHAETTTGGRTIYVTTCVGSLRVYHAYVASREVIVSLFSVGTRLFGDQVMAALRG
jgi:hypothetical protein